MASTAEELAAQASQLLESIAFFKIASGDAPARRMISPGPAEGLHRGTAVRPAITARPERRLSGVQIDLHEGQSGNRDEKDSEFEKF